MHIWTSTPKLVLGVEQSKTKNKRGAWKYHLVKENNSLADRRKPFVFFATEAVDSFSYIPLPHRVWHEFCSTVKNKPNQLKHLFHLDSNTWVHFLYKPDKLTDFCSVKILLSSVSTDLVLEAGLSEKVHCRPPGSFWPGNQEHRPPGRLPPFHRHKQSAKQKKTALLSALCTLINCVVGDIKRQEKIYCILF